MDRRLLIPTVAAVHGSDLVWNQLTLHLVIHMKIQSQALAGQGENPALCLRKKGICLFRQCWGCVLHRDTECILPWARGK